MTLLATDFNILAISNLASTLLVLNFSEPFIHFFLYFLISWDFSPIAPSGHNGSCCVQPAETYFLYRMALTAIHSILHLLDLEFSRKKLDGFYWSW